MSAFTVFHPAVYCLTIGSASWAPTQSSFLGGQWVLTQTEDPHSGIPPFRKEGGEKDKRRGKKITDRRQVTVYIQVRPTFYQSKTIHSICMQNLLRLDALKSRVWSQCSATWDTYRRGNWKALRPSENQMLQMKAVPMGSHFGESSPGMIWFLFNTSALNIGISSLNKSWKR